MKLVYFSPVPWRSFSQRSHEMVNFFRKQCQGEVLWVDPYPTRLPAWQDMARIKAVDTPQAPLPSWLSLVAPKALPVEPIAGVHMLNYLLWRDTEQTIADFADADTILVIGKPSKLALRVLAACDFKQTIYDAMDNFPAFYRGISATAMARTERKIAKRVSHVIASSQHCQQRLSAFGLTPRLVYNGCASDRLPPVSSRAPRALTLGYVGTIGHWFDWSLVVHLAVANPDYRIRLIGPVFVPVPESLPRNIILEPLLEHTEALEVMKEFDAGLIPFILSSLTDSVDPIKYYEYKAMGLGVISSAFGEMRYRGGEAGVFLMSHNSDIPALVGKAQHYSPSALEIAQFRQQHDWHKRFTDACLFA